MHFYVPSVQKKNPHDECGRGERPVVNIMCRNNVTVNGTINIKINGTLVRKEFVNGHRNMNIDKFEDLEVSIGLENLNVEDAWETVKDTVETAVHKETEMGRLWDHIRTEIESAPEDPIERMRIARKLEHGVDSTEMSDADKLECFHWIAKHLYY